MNSELSFFVASVISRDPRLVASLYNVLVRIAKAIVMEIDIDNPANSCVRLKRNSIQGSYYRRALG